MTGDEEWRWYADPTHVRETARAKHRFRRDADDLDGLDQPELAAWLRRESDVAARELRDMSDRRRADRQLGQGAGIDASGLGDRGIR